MAETETVLARCHSLCLNFLTYLPESQIQKNVLFIQTNSFIFHLFESTFTCPVIWASGLARRLISDNYNNSLILFLYCSSSCLCLVRDSSAVRRLQQVEQKAVGRQRNLGLVCVMISVILHRFSLLFGCQRTHREGCIVIP